MQVLKRKYGLWTAIAMVVGIVIGSGVFFKADDVLKNTNGVLWQSLLAWLCGGLIMVVTAYCFSLMAGRFSKINGVVDYVEVSSNKVIGYGMGWYMATAYFPILVSILAFVSTQYLCSLTGLVFATEETGVQWYVWQITILLIILSFLLNIIAPKIAGKYQITATAIKLIPIFVVAIIATLIGLFNGNTVAGFTHPAFISDGKSDFGLAVLATAFAYDGWSVATSINAELKDSKRNLPKALVIGSLIVIFAYLLYYVGLSSVISNSDILAEGNNAPVVAFKALLGNVGGVLFNFFIVVSCLGTLNGLTLGCIRGIYSLAIRNRGPEPKVFSQLNPKTNTSITSSLVGFALTMFFLDLWYLGIQQGLFPGNMDELVIALIYSSYLFVFIWMMINFKEFKFVKRFVIPSLGIVGALFLVLAATGLYELIFKADPSVFYNFLKFMAVIVPLMIVGMLFYKKQDDELSSTLETEEPVQK